MKELEVAKLACYKAGNFLLNLKENKINSNNEKDIKLQADLDSEKIICEILQNVFDYPILSEESYKINDEEKKGIYWVVDPLDGSLNFSQSIPLCCISIALYENDNPILGVIYDFYRDEMFSGVIGFGAWLNDKKIIPSGTKKNKKQAVLATGFSSYMDYDKIGLEKFISYIQEFKKVRLFGSAALSLAYVACERVDAYYEKDIAFWDIAAGIAILACLHSQYKSFFSQYSAIVKIDFNIK
ncbi:inositol monophosphatase [Campylobacter jejuni]|uniref:Inositol monophosphatase n=2 Tax=Campylobacter jejuni TaxID=197 RepID=A0A5T1V883_CAMJU|nr:inositol monophosphatase family protein [Campylobacter jejuni]EAL9390991.1 inositol monophosphatase [Campylobacter coli]AJK71586.1 inositol monophosphatase [Campylobacter jejuni subsp. jejuni]ALT31882.1 inositol monophosphatase family protein [Campylobacter jejuni subsp. jejuni]EAH4617260.1 inositol monophosphatase [Campylobacter jejuni]EAH6389131.1 inositol monophosphatase [Campylobacter jejuni]